MLSGFNVFGNETISTGSWHPEPLARGTFSVLSSCLFTLVLCVWSAIHINIRPKRARRSVDSGSVEFTSISILPLKIGWTLMAVFAPELVAFTAWHQLRCAYSIDKAASNSPKVKFPNKGARQGQHEDVEHELLGPREHRVQHRKYAWTTTHSYYAVMGGFVIDTAATRDIALNYSEFRRFQTISSAGVEFLLEYYPEVIPDIDEIEILDKSKSDWFAKAIVCIQGAWFCSQCISRLASDLTISLLELNTLGHCICMFFIYCMWWKKPLDIQQPTFITSTDGMDFYIYCLFLKEYYESEKDFLGLNMYRFAEFNQMPVDNIPRDRHIFEMKTKGDFIRETISQSIFGVERAESAIEKDYDEFIRTRFNNDAVSIQTNSRWHSASRATVKVGLDSNHEVRYPPSMALVERNRNWPSSRGSVRDIGTAWVLAGIWIAGIIYGGLHLLAWNAPFPTLAQQRLWRISTTTLTASGPMFTFSVGLGYLGDLLDERVGSDWIGLLGLVHLAFFFFYVFCRVYLVVECFIMLPYLPPSAFRVPAWSQYFVHFS